MVVIRFSPPASIEVTGGHLDFDALWQGVNLFLCSMERSMSIPVETRADPCPYEELLPSLRLTKTTGSARVTVSDGELCVEGSVENLSLFNGWFSFERSSVPERRHHEYHEGNQWVSPESMPLVIALE